MQIQTANRKSTTKLNGGGSDAFKTIATPSEQESSKYGGGGAYSNYPAADDPNV
jgi:hypothetical protein